MLKQRTTPTTESSPYQAEVAKLQAVVAAYQAAEASVRAMKFALTLSLNGDWDRDGVAAGLREDARPWRRQAEKRPDKLRSDILDSEIALADKRPDYVDALEAMQAAHRAETDRIALQLAPEHRKATTAVVRAMEALSRAIADERAVRARLATTAPLQTSAYLPDTSGALGVGELSELNSPAWRWAQELRRAGFGGH